MLERGRPPKAKTLGRPMRELKPTSPQGHTHLAQREALSVERPLSREKRGQKSPVFDE